MIGLIVFSACAADEFASVESSVGAFPLVTSGAAAGIVVDAGDFRVVHIAAADLAEDIERVSDV